MITGTITLKDGTVIEVSDANLVSDGLSVSMSTSSGGEFDIGTFNAAEMKLKIMDEDSLLHEFDGAKIELSVFSENAPANDEESAETASESTETSPDSVESKLGVFYVSGDKTIRKGTFVSLTAYDAATLFDTEIPSGYRSGTWGAYSLVRSACDEVGVDFAHTVTEFYKLELINHSDKQFSLSAESVHTWRDALMWVAQAICANMVINTDGALEVRRVRYTDNGTTITVDREITGDDRVSIRFSDIRTYIKYLSAYCKDTRVSYTSAFTSTDSQARPAQFELPKNPLMSKMSEEDQETVNSDWLKHIDSFKQREIKAQVVGSPVVKLGETIRFSGGVIDVRRTLIGVATDITWKYNGISTVICRAPMAVGKETGSE